MVVALFVILAAGGMAARSNAAEKLNLIPTPKVVKQGEGEMPLTAEGRIV
jgi:hypothetical protein